MDICPICKRKTEDIRHVSVECFYAVDEIIPETEHEVVFKEIPKEGSHLGKTRTYKEGTIDDFHIEEEEREDKTPICHVINNPKPTNEIRLLELNVYRRNCCKSCRADFMQMMKDWSQGNLIRKKS